MIGTQGGGGQSDKKVLPCADLALNFIPFSRITIFEKKYPFQGFFAENFQKDTLFKDTYFSNTLFKDAYF